VQGELFTHQKTEWMVVSTRTVKRESDAFKSRKLKKGNESQDFGVLKGKENRTRENCRRSLSRIEELSYS